jgi:3-methyl-2-oxobutanoate hydroxymethyltransferase
MSARTTVPSVQGRKVRRGDVPLVMVTAYDATFGRLLDQAGADVLLVGDSLGMVIQGNDSTLPVTLPTVPSSRSHDAAPL